jgi:catechol-2,3-dioxygenase
VIQLRRIDHVCLRVRDVADATRRYALQFGLTVRDQDEERSTLACDYEDYSLELIRCAADHEPGFAHCAWQLRRSVDLGQARSHLADRGVAYTEDAATLIVRDPEGFEQHLVAFRADPDRRPAIARHTTTLPGLRPRKLGHVNRLTADMAGVVGFYTDVLGMQVTDYLGDTGTWLRIASEHHQLALVHTGQPHFHHFALDYYDFGTLRALLDNLAQHGRWLAWGPLRHGVGQNICFYSRITEEPLMVECYVDMEQLDDDHQPRRWPDDRHSSNTWGPLPPRSYFRFDQAAIDSERDSAEMTGTPLPPAEGGT